MDILRKWWFIIAFFISLIFNAGGFYTTLKIRNNDMNHIEKKQDKILDMIIKLSNKVSNIEGRMEK